MRRHLNKKIVIIINGKGGAGKDTACAIATEHYHTQIISAITPIKELARQCGWGGEKDHRSRKFLSDLKRLLVKYNNLPNTYLDHQYALFLQSNYDLLFVHIREADQMDAFKSKVSVNCVTLLIKSPYDVLTYGNSSDDDVENYQYDYSFNNDQSIAALKIGFPAFLSQLLSREGLMQID